jgi:predicted kinase
MTKTLYILVGLPGSGKSTFILENFGMGVICSADHWFVRTGSYIFKPEELPQAHAFSKGKCEGAMHADCEQIFIDNTNLTKWERKDYIAMGKAYGYEIQIKFFDVTPEVSAARNTHGVPLEACQRMHDRLSAYDLAVDISDVMDHNAALKRAQEDAEDVI